MYNNTLAGLVGAVDDGRGAVLADGRQQGDAQHSHHTEVLHRHQLPRSALHGVTHDAVAGAALQAPV